MDNEILTVEEAAALLKAPVDTVASLMESGELPGRQIAGYWRTTKRALVSYVEGVPLQMMCCTPEMCCPPGTGTSGASGCCC